MTLVFACTCGKSSYMFGDSMLTTKRAQNLGAITYPTEPIAELSSATRYVAGLAQKIVRLRPNIFLGWSGNLHIATKHIRYLRDLLQSPLMLDKDILCAQQDYFRLHATEAHELWTILLRQEPGFVYIGSATRHSKCVHPAFGEVLVIGSGSQAFLDYLNAVPMPSVSKVDDGAPSDATQIGYVLNYLATTMNHQQATGFGVDDGWGAAFEVVLSKDGKSLEKLDNVLYQTYHWRQRDNGIDIFRQGRRYLQYYVEDNLVVLAQGKSEQMRVWVIPPPEKVFQSPLVVPRPFRSPEMVCTHLMNIDTQKSRTPLQWREGGSPHYGVAPFENQGLSIRANTEAVKDLIRTLAADDAPSPP